ncbi:MAG: hypothetical protein CFE37_00125 [Alphaproteobacteria bacterium PA4]|nr:MAG: hypothetical protein CFE37_00125 [Alphaproteobacteria bacterium PA4]
MANWNPEQVQQQLKAHERRKHDDAARCRTEVRFVKADYRRFYDEETAEETVAFVLGTASALESRDRMLVRLEEMRRDVTDGRLDATGIYDAATFREAAIDFIDHLKARFTDTSRPVDIRSF